MEINGITIDENIWEQTRIEQESDITILNEDNGDVRYFKKKEPPKRKSIIINNIEYELEQHDNGKKLSEIKILDSWRLLLPSEAMMLYERGLIDSSFWFFVQQTNEDEKKKGKVARFGASSDGALLYCDRNPNFAVSSLGVLFAKNLEENKSK